MSAVFFDVPAAGGIAALVIKAGITDEVVPASDVAKGGPAILFPVTNPFVEIAVDFFETFGAEAAETFVAELDGEYVINEASACCSIPFRICEDFVAVPPELVKYLKQRSIRLIISSRYSGCLGYSMIAVDHRLAMSIRRMFSS